MHRLSSVIITYNEEHSLGRTLDSLAWCDEVVVMDSGSTDRTLEIAGSYPNCRTVIQPFLGYGPQKRKAVEAATHDWVLSVDADEVLDRQLQDSLQSWRRTGENEPAGYWVERQLVFMGRKFTRGRESRGRVLRLFDRRRGGFDDALIHERATIAGEPGRVEGRLLHYTYRDLDEYFDKFNRYTSQMARDLYGRGRRPSMAAMILRLPVTFLGYYLLRGNWMNGFPGFVWSLLAANYRTVKYLKLYELTLAGRGAQSDDIGD